MNEARLQAFLARAYYDLAAASSAVLVALGDRLGLYRGMAGRGAITPAELAVHTGTNERYVREWLVNQAASGYVEHDRAAGTFLLPDEHAAVLATDDGRATLTGAFQIAQGLSGMADQLARAFRTGAGVESESYPSDVFEGMARAARARCETFLIGAWLPALEGVAARLEAGGQVADLGCGGGAALIQLARAFPRSRFVGFDSHDPSVAMARTAAAAAGVAEQVRFEAAPVSAFTGSHYDLILALDSLHEWPDPAAVASRVRGALAPAGSWLIVEPWTEEAVGAPARLASAVSTQYCLPVSLAQAGPGLGALLGEDRVRALLLEGGLTRVRRLDDPNTLALDARP
jgi:SAM-dependent methyltransferase